MERIITLRHTGKCKVCSAGILPGDRAIWGGKGSGVRHTTCGDQTIPQSPPKPDENENEYTVDFTEIRDDFRSIVAGNRTYSVNRKKAGNLPTETWNMERWVGCTMQDMLGWLDAGYRVQGLDGIDASLIQAKPKRRLRFNEDDGEMHLDIAWSGSDNIFSDWEKRNRKPGLRVLVEMSWHAGENEQAIRPYLVWLARMLQAFDENSIDVEISVSYRCFNMLVADSKDYRTNQKYRTNVRVKKPGEASDISAWSAMFSPGGFRQLMFVGIVKHAEALGKEVSSGLGRPNPSKQYDVQYDAESNTLHVLQAHGTFPEFDMTQKLQAIMSTIQG